MRFCLVDRILEIKSGESVTAVKNLTLSEEYLADHFPGFAVMPGVLMVECMVQTSAWLMRQTENFRYSTVLLKQAKAVKFNSFVRPGQTLTVKSTIQKRDTREYAFKVAGTVDGNPTVSGRLTLEQFNLADEVSHLGDNDQLRIAGMKHLYAQICCAGVSSAS